jgi:dolichol-phosphate mannosyltransferase
MAEDLDSPTGDGRRNCPGRAAVGRAAPVTTSHARAMAARLGLPAATCREATPLIVPTYNERDNIEELCERFFAHLDGATLLVVDDASPDGTAEVCARLKERFPQLELLRRDGPRGLGRAYVAGMDWALARDYALIGTMDADLSHDLAHLPAMLALTGNAEVVIGSR